MKLQLLQITQTLASILRGLQRVISLLWGMVSVCGAAIYKHLGAVMFGIAVALFFIIIFWNPNHPVEIQHIQQNGMECMGIKGNPASWHCDWQRAPNNK